MTDPNVEDAINRIVAYWEFERGMQGYISPKIQGIYQDWPEFARAIERLVTFSKRHLSS